MFSGVIIAETSLLLDIVHNALPSSSAKNIGPPARVFVDTGHFGKDDASHKFYIDRYLPSIMIQISDFRSACSTGSLVGKSIVQESCTLRFLHLCSVTTLQPALLKFCSPKKMSLATVCSPNLLRRRQGSHSQTQRIWKIRKNHLFRKSFLQR
jgi:hypothetical protein